MDKMRDQVRRFSAGLLCALGFGLVAAPAQAHPHAWIDLRSTVVLDEQGHVSANTAPAQ